MSIMYELHKSIGKRPCTPGSRAKRCPMVINSESEDLLTSNVFGLLKYLSPALWLIPLLECAFKGRTFQAFGQNSVKIDFWKKLPSPTTAKYREGTEEIDLVIRIRHLIILIECKFKATVNMGRPGTMGRDQLARYIDAAAFNYWPDSNARREIFLLLLTDTAMEPEILSHYRNPEKVFECLTQTSPFVDYEHVSQAFARNIGWVTWKDILKILDRLNVKTVGPTEAMITRDVIEYLRYKL